MSTPEVVGLDLSLTATGVADVDGGLHTVRSTPCGKSWEERLDRYLGIRVELNRAGQLGNLIVIEGYSYGAKGAGHHDIVELGTIIRNSLSIYGARIAEVPPTVLKKYATGKGNATKPDMRMELYKRTGLDVADDNQVDAWWLRAMGLDWLGHAPVALPAAQRKMLGSVVWPLAAGGGE